MKKVKPGDRLAIPAMTFNTFVDTAQDFLDRQRSTGQRSTQSFRQTGIVLVKNNSGADRGRFDVLGIDGPIFTPTDSLDTFKNRVALKGVTPDIDDHPGAFVVLQEPVAAGELGRAILSGVTPVKVNVADAGHRYAEISDGEAGYLASAESGSALILWKEADTGEKWAIIKLGMPSAEAGSTAFPAKIVSSQGSATYTVREQAITGGGSFADKSGTSNITAKNLAELTLGPGSAVDAGQIVLVMHMLDEGDGDRYIFDHPAYAKYLD